ncbi:hypothetical protein Bca4012_053116 [Brassica carinata]
MAKDNTRRTWNPRAGPYLGEVSSLAFLSLPQHVCPIPYLLAEEVKIFALVVELGSSGGEVSVGLEVLESLPRLSNWVFDVCFLKDSCESLEAKEDKLLAIGCSDNSVCVWDVKESRMVLEVQSPERCLLYTMRLWGSSISTLRIASGTIFNEIIVWKAAGLDGDNLGNGQYCASHMLRLADHEG